MYIFKVTIKFRSSNINMVSVGSTVDFNFLLSCSCNIICSSLFYFSGDYNSNYFILVHSTAHHSFTNMIDLKKKIVHHVRQIIMSKS